MSTEQIELRAERLRVTLFMFGQLHGPTFEEMCADSARRMSAGEFALFQSTDREDLGLSNECLAIEYDMRRREWEALEELLGAIPRGGNLDDIFDLPVPEQLDALHAAVACRWFRPGGEA